jgi:hypothetical protein
VSLGVGVEEVIRPRVVLVDAALDQPHAKDAGVEVEILLRRAGDGRDVVEAVDAAHAGILYHRCAAPADRVGRGRFAGDALRVRCYEVFLAWASSAVRISE